MFMAPIAKLLIIEKFINTYKVGKASANQPVGIGSIHCYVPECVRISGSMFDIKILAT